MAVPCTTQMQIQYQPGSEDFGFNAMPEAAVSPPEINALPCGSEDFGFNAIPEAAVSPPEINTPPPHESEDFGFDAPLLEHQSMTNSDVLREKEVLGRDAELLTEEESVEGTLLECEDFEMDSPVQSNAQGPSINLWNMMVTWHWPNHTVWTWGQRAPPARDTKIGATSSRSHTGAHAKAGDSHLWEYKARASILLAEAKRIQRLYSELQQVYDIDAELTDAVEKMTEECGLRK
ncbi:hypothetical protein EI94DRAFT_1702656 [Lactarius quietus]|nr:hypothetical protein EI94DRAFT_1702656 [Lactarius quietus]